MKVLEVNRISSWNLWIFSWTRQSILGSDSMMIKTEWLTNHWLTNYWLLINWLCLTDKDWELQTSFISTMNKCTKINTTWRATVRCGWVPVVTTPTPTSQCPQISLSRLRALRVPHPEPAPEPESAETKSGVKSDHQKMVIMELLYCSTCSGIYF